MQTILTGRRRSIRKSLPGPAAAARRVRRWLDVWSERRSLMRLDERALADLGLTPADVRREARRSPFDLPAGRW
ncbi:DUF1127 domain-containing protein [Acuticoccus sp. MNP-M23]|uniref:DUF1127 domain-containing protein n=1 Tax=Acuticoccus sp. MNP-M23 TaxID=3072793 RepID=UPI0028165EA2|nr:DUF1127 domain-containing protein [Acuticoccus sp. MNP-M23]WMS42906.1 DUF1127 domain-containing protein [Acuticoccus sp. MNP-M23]